LGIRGLVSGKAGEAVFGFDVGEVGEVARIRELIEINHNPIRVFTQHITDEIGADETTTASYQ